MGRLAQACLGVATDMAEDAGRPQALPRGLVDTKVRAIDAT